MSVRTSASLMSTVDRIVDHRIDPDAGEGGVAARLAVEGRDAHQAVDAGFGLQPAVGGGPDDLERRRLDAGLLAVVDLQRLDLVAALLAEAGVHAHQHRRPILAFGAAGAGVDLDVGVVAVGLAGQHRLDLAALGLDLQRLQRLLRLGDDGAVALRLGEFDHVRLVGELLLKLPDAGDLVVQPLALAHHRLGALRVVPEVGVFGGGVEFDQPRLGAIPVKDAPSAGRSPARCRRRWSGFRGASVVPSATRRASQAGL